ALLLMFTGGVGNAVHGASKIRHAGKLESLGSIFRNLGRLLKRKKLQRKVRVKVDTERAFQTELPEDKRVSTQPNERVANSQTPKRPRPEPNGFDGPDGYRTHGIKEPPLESPEGRALVESYEAQGMSREQAVARAANLMESGSTYPRAIN